jgi:hypothetical protein
MRELDDGRPFSTSPGNMADISAGVFKATGSDKARRAGST